MLVLAAVTSSMAWELDSAFLLPLLPAAHPRAGRSSRKQPRLSVPASLLARGPQCGVLASGQFTIQARIAYGNTMKLDLK